MSLCLVIGWVHVSLWLNPLDIYLSSPYTELERLNMECEGTMSRECSLDAVEARNLLKVALASQATVESAWSRRR